MFVVLRRQDTRFRGAVGFSSVVLANGILVAFDELLLIIDYFPVHGTATSITLRQRLGVRYINTNQLRISRSSWAMILMFAFAGVHFGYASYSYLHPHVCVLNHLLGYCTSPLSRISQSMFVRVLLCLQVGKEDEGAKNAPRKCKLQVMLQVPQDDVKSGALLFRMKKRWDLF